MNDKLTTKDALKGINYAIAGVQSISYRDRKDQSKKNDDESQPDAMIGLRVFYRKNGKTKSVDLGCEGKPVLYSKTSSNICQIIDRNGGNQQYGGRFFTYEMNSLLIARKEDKSNQYITHVTFTACYDYLDIRSTFGSNSTDDRYIEHKSEDNMSISSIELETIGDGLIKYVSDIVLEYHPVGMIDFLPELMERYWSLKIAYPINYMMEGGLKKTVNDLCKKIKKHTYPTLKHMNEYYRDKSHTSEKLIKTMAYLIYYQCFLKGEDISAHPQFKEGSDHSITTTNRNDYCGVYSTETGALILEISPWSKDLLFFGEEPISDIKFSPFSRGGKAFPAIKKFLDCFEKTYNHAIMHKKYQEIKDEPYTHKIVAELCCAEFKTYNDKTKHITNYGYTPFFKNQPIRDDNLNRIQATYLPSTGEKLNYAKGSESDDPDGSVTYNNKMRDYDDYIEKTLNSAKINKSDIIIFPELFIYNDKIRGYLITRLNASQLENVRFVVAGSYFYLNDEDYYKPIHTNKLVILYHTLDDNGGSNWQDLTTYEKAVPMSGFKNPLASVEKIESKQEITLLKAGNVVYGFAICRDVLDLLNPLNPINQYKGLIDVLVVISENSGHTNMFTGIAETVARWYHCATLYCNTLGALTKLDDKYTEIQLSIFPSLKVSTSADGVIYYQNNPFQSMSRPQEKNSNHELMIFENKSIEMKALPSEHNGVVSHTLKMGKSTKRSV